MKSIKTEYAYWVEYLNEQGLLHREDGPAREYSNGTKAWFINGKLHREDGPAVEHGNGDEEWYLNGDLFYEEEYHQEVIKLKLKRILDL
jgi:hypothetical protein